MISGSSIHVEEDMIHAKVDDSALQEQSPTSTHSLHKQVGIAGYQIEAGEDETNLRKHTVSDLASDIFGYFDTRLRESLMFEPRIISSALTMKMDTAISIDDVTQRPQF